MEVVWNRMVFSIFRRFYDISCYKQLFFDDGLSPGTQDGTSNARLDSLFLSFLLPENGRLCSISFFPGKNPFVDVYK